MPRKTRRAPARRIGRPVQAAAADRAGNFALVLRVEGLPAPTAEHRFAPPRRWRFDYAWPDYGVALEVEGGVYTRGRHTRGAGYARDMEKYSEAAARGWLLIRVQPRDLCAPQTLDWIRRALAAARVA